MKPGIHLRVIWFDDVEDLLEVAFSGSNGLFSGETPLYVSSKNLSKFAEVLTGFPKRGDDTRDFELGSFSPNYAGGGVRMRFRCKDVAGHAVVEVKLRDHSCSALGELESVALSVPIEAAGVDEFVRQLRIVRKAVGASAYLPQTGRRRDEC